MSLISSKCDVVFVFVMAPFFCLLSQSKQTSFRYATTFAGRPGGNHRENDLCLVGLLSVCRSVCPSVCLSVYLSVRSSVCPSVCLSVCPSVRLSICLAVRSSVCLSVRPSVYLSVCPSIRPSVCLSVRPSVCLPICLSVRPFVCLSVCPSFLFSNFALDNVVKQKLELSVTENCVKLDKLTF